MSVVQSQDPIIMSFTDNAAAKVHSLITEEDNENLKLRVFVTGGGCSGFQYGFSFDEEIAEDDTVIEKKGASLLVDSLSFQYLLGAKIDYVEGLEGPDSSSIIPWPQLPVAADLLFRFRAPLNNTVMSQLFLKRSVTRHTSPAKLPLLTYIHTGDGLRPWQQV